MKISCVCVSSQYFASGSQIWSLRLLNSQTEPRKKEWDWEFLLKLCTFEFWRVFILLYYLHVPFVLLVGKISSVSLCCCLWWCLKERSRGLVLNVGLHFWNICSTVQNQPPWLLCVASLVLLQSLCECWGQGSSPPSQPPPSAQGWGERDWCWASFWKQCPNNASAALSLAAQGPAVILGLISPCINTGCSVLHMPITSVLCWIWAVSVKLSEKWVCG